jgi:site-specific recombinase XerD
MAILLPEWKQRFLEYIEIEKGRSIKTVENYDRYLERFIRFSKLRKAEEISYEHVREYRLWLNRQSATPQGVKHVAGTLKKRTQNYYMIALRAFLKYLTRQGVTVLSPEKIELAKTPERELDLMSALDLERLLSAPNGETLKTLRDRAILEH